MPAFRTARHQHPEIVDEEELLPYILVLQDEASSLFDQTLEACKIQSEAIYKVIIMFRKLYLRAV